MNVYYILPKSHFKRSSSNIQWLENANVKISIATLKRLCQSEDHFFPLKFLFIIASSNPEDRYHGKRVERKILSIFLQFILCLGQHLVYGQFHHSLIEGHLHLVSHTAITLMHSSHTA